MKAGSAEGWRLPLALIFAAALCLRLAQLGTQPLWTDEAFSLWFARQSFDYIWTVAPSFEPPPPLYYSLLRVWRVFGESEWALRSLSVLFSTGALLFVWLAARKLLEEHSSAAKVALLAAALVAVSPIQVRYAQEARAYAAMSFAIALLLYAAAHIAAARASRREPIWPWAVAAIALALTAWFQYVGLLYWAAFALFLLFNWKDAHQLSAGYASRALLAGIAASLLFAPQLPWLVQQTQGWQASTWIAPPSPGSVALTAIELFGARLFPFGFNLKIPLVLLFTAIAGVGAISLWRRGLRSPCVLLVLLTFLPFLLALGVSLAGVRILVYRSLLPSNLSFCILVAAGLAALPTRKLRIAAAAIVLALFGASTVMHSVGRQKEPWPEIARYVAERSTHADLVVVMPTETEVPFQTYYRHLRDDAPLIVAPVPFPAVGLDAPYPAGSAGTPGLTPAYAEAVSRRAGAVPGRVFVVSRNRALFDPADSLGAALSRDRQHVGTEAPWSLIEVREYARRSAAEPSPR